VLGLCAAAEAQMCFGDAEENLREIRQPTGEAVKHVTPTYKVAQFGLGDPRSMPSKQPSRTCWSQGHLDASLEGWALEGMVVVGRQVGGKGKEKNGEINTLPQSRTSYLPETRLS